MKDDECRDTSTNFSTVEIVKQQTKEQKKNAVRDGEYVCGSKPPPATSAENALYLTTAAGERSGLSLGLHIIGLTMLPRSGVTRALIYGHWNSKI
jgi:hypothetical protein